MLEWIHVICMAESLPCSPETTTTLLIGYTLVQNKKFGKKNNSGYCNWWDFPGGLVAKTLGSQCWQTRLDDPWSGN